MAAKGYVPRHLRKRPERHAQPRSLGALVERHPLFTFTSGVVALLAFASIVPIVIG